MFQLLTGPIVIAGAGTLITSFFQDRAEQIRLTRERRQAELDQSGKILAELTEAMFITVLRERKPQPEDKQIWEGYTAALLQWKKRQTMLLAGSTMQFGKESSDQFQSIVDDLATLERQVAATRHGRTQSKYFLVDPPDDSPPDENNFRTKYFNVRRRMEAAMLKLNETLIARIQREHVGSLIVRGV